MARNRKRQYGSGEVVERETGLAIRWREPILMPDGSIKHRRRFLSLGPVSRKEAARRLAEKVAENGSLSEPLPSVTFREHAARWSQDILPMYKFSVQESYRMILEKHLVPRFGNTLVSAATPEASRFLVNVQTVQAFISEARDQEYAPHTIHHFHEVLRAVLKHAVKWYGGLESNPAEGVTLPKLKAKTKPWALTMEQAAQLVAKLKDKPKPRAAVWLLITTGIRRGEYLAVRWRNLDEERGVLKINEAFYRGHLDTPKTEAGVREVALDPIGRQFLRDWKALSKRTAPADFIFGTRNGKPDRPENLLYRHVFPACDKLGIPRATFLAFRRTFSTWSHYSGIPAKDIAALMGHAGVSTQFIYVQTMDDAKRAAAERIGAQLATIGHFSDNEIDYVH